MGHHAHYYIRDETIAEAMNKRGRGDFFITDKYDLFSNHDKKTNR